MADIAQGMRFKIDLDAGLVQRPQRAILMRNDKNANKIIIEVTRKGYMEQVNLDGVSVVGEFVRQSGERVPLTGTTSGNVATVLLNAHCYVETGQFKAFIRFKLGDAMRTVLYISGNVSKDADGPIIDAENIIPSLDELLAQIEEMKRATAAANEAAEKAESVEGRLTDSIADLKDDFNESVGEKIRPVFQKEFSDWQSGNERFEVKINNRYIGVKSNPSLGFNFLGTLKNGTWEQKSEFDERGVAIIEPAYNTLYLQANSGNPYSGSIAIVDVTNKEHIESFIIENGYDAINKYYDSIIDMSLTIPNKASDAKVVGDIIIPQIDNRYIVEDCADIPDSPCLNSDAGQKIDHNTVMLPYDTASDVNVVQRVPGHKKYAIISTASISNVRALHNSGTWKDFGSVTDNVGIIDVVNAVGNVSLGLYIKTSSGGEHKFYVIDITGNEELENFTMKYKLKSINRYYKGSIHQYLYDLEQYVADNISNDNTWHGKKYVAYGDSITEQNFYPEYVKRQMRFKTQINKGLGGTCVAKRSDTDASWFGSDERINTFPTDADLITIMGGTNDFGRNIEIGDLSYRNGFDVTKFKGALATTVIKIQSRCPNARIIICSPIGGRGISGNSIGVKENIPVKNDIGLTTGDYAKACKDVAEFMNVAYCNTYCCGINGWNRDLYIADSVHPTSLGAKRIAEKLIGTIKSIQPIEDKYFY